MNKVILIFLAAVIGVIVYIYFDLQNPIQWLMGVERREPVTDLKDYQPGSLTK